MKDPKPWTKAIYENTAAALKKSREKKVVAHGNRIKWLPHKQAEKTGTKTGMLVSPKLGFDTELSMFLEEIPPGGHNNRHRHYLYAVKYLMRGRGHEVIDGERHNLREGDAILIPPGSWHQTFNDDKKNPLRFLAAATHMRFPILDELMDEGLG